MTFEQWLAAAGFDPAALSDAQKKPLLAQWKADVAATADGQTADGLQTLEQVTAAARAEQERQRKITDLVAQKIGEAPQMLSQIEALGRAAVSGKWAVERLELELLRLCRPGVAFTPFVETPADNAAVVEAAVCMAGNLPNIEKQFPAQVLEAARARWRHGLGLGELVLTFARRGGYHGLTLAGNLKGALQAAFSTPGTPALRAVEVPSTYQLPNILSNVANKYIAAGFNAVDASWRQIAATRSVKDFKQITSFSLTGGLMYKKVAPSGEIQYGTVGEAVYNNKADTYALILGIARTDLINDDMNALSGAAFRLGRGGALKVNDIFWSVFLNNSTFFSSGNSNVLTGAGSALSLTALGTADAKFRVQTDPDGFPIGIMPRKLVVPTTLRITAANLINSTFVVSTNTAQTGVLAPGTNVLAGMYELVSSPYMENANYTGNSNAAWYLLADPADLPAIEVCFLNGVQQPTVETADADFNQLGIGMRGVFDFGVALQEYRAGNRSAGS